MRAILVAAVLLCTPVVASAQYAITQDSSLKGIRKVYLNFTDIGGVLGTELARRIADDAALELRKTGLKVARAPEELNMREDAILNMGVVYQPNSGDLTLRMDVEQKAQLVRTQQVLQMVTWYHEDAVRGGAKSSGQPLVMKGVNRFLSQWLDQNGR